MTKKVQWDNGNGLWEVRSEAVDSQRAAAERTGQSYRTIQRLECGQVKRPHNDTINAIQEAYNVAFTGIEYKGRLAEKPREQQK